MKKAPMILGTEMGKMLEEVAKGRKTAQDFSEYFCGQLDKQVTYNVLVASRLKETKVTTFNKMCEELKGERDRRVKDIIVVIYRDPVTQCILSLQVTLKKSRV